MSVIVPHRYNSPPVDGHLGNSSLTRGLVFAAGQPGVLHKDIITRTDGNDEGSGITHDATGLGWMRGGFTSSSTRITWPGSARTQPTTPFSMAVWIRVGASTAGNQRIFSNGVCTPRYAALEIVLSTGEGLAEFGDDTGTGTGDRRSTFGGTTLNPGEIHLLAADYAGAGFDPNIYVDGVKDNVSASGAAPNIAYNGTQIQLGAYTIVGVTNQHFQGEVGPAFIWNRRLSDMEHRMLYNPATRWSMFSNPVAYVNVPGAPPVGNNGFPIIDRYYRQLMAA